MMKYVVSKTTGWTVNEDSKAICVIMVGKVGRGQSQAVPVGGNIPGTGAEATSGSSCNFCS